MASLSTSTLRIEGLEYYDPAMELCHLSSPYCSSSAILPHRLEKPAFLTLCKMDRAPTILQEDSCSQNSVSFNTWFRAHPLMIFLYSTTKRPSKIDLQYDSRNVSWKSAGCRECWNITPEWSNAWRSQRTAEVCKSWKYLHILALSCLHISLIPKASSAILLK